MSDVAIKFENVSKLYELGTVGTGTLSHDLKRWWITSVLHKEDPYLKIGETNDRSTKGDSKFVYALKDIDFEVKQGDVLGIIGKNGAGKSTLLKLLSRVTYPTTGNIYVNGRIASLLEVGTGFHPELTGRENIYMNGTILGMKKWEIDKQLDEIVDFSGCERYLDTPVKRYSSGMTVRLGFAIAAHLNPEILVVDEVLAVGDAEFQKKAIGKMQDVSKGQGRTVLFVSHNMGSVLSLCKSGLLLTNGCQSMLSDAKTCVNQYLNESRNISLHQKVTIESNSNNDSIADVKFVSFSFCKNTPCYASDEDIVLEIVVRSEKKERECRINCTIYDSSNNPIGSNTSFETFLMHPFMQRTILYKITNPSLVVGLYNVSFSIGIGDTTFGETNYDIANHVISFEIDSIKKGTNLHYAKWEKWWGDIFLSTKLIQISNECPY